MQNRDVAHQFFYDINGSFERRSMTVSYEHNKYYSYGTVIGKITQTTEGQTVCLISDNNFSMTTAKHINELRHACPFDVVHLPQAMYAHDFNAYDVVERLKSNIEYYSNAKLTQKANREGFINSYKMLISTLKLADFEAQFEKAQKILDEYKELYDTLNNPSEIKALKEKVRKIEAEKQAKLKKELETIFNKYTYLDILKFTYTDFYFNDFSVEAYNEQKELKQKIKKYLNPHNDFSFIWFEGDFVRTSQHISVDKKEAITLLKLWKNGKLKHGMTISYYTVLEVLTNYVKIGCHRIPVDNLNALYEAIDIKKEVA